MAKQKTRAELIEENAVLQNEIDRRDKKIMDLKESVDHEKRSNVHFIDGMVDTLIGGSYRGDRTGLGLNFIHSKLGKLLFIEDQYHELKDRMLPLEKSKVLENERRDITSGHNTQGFGPLN